MESIIERDNVLELLREDKSIKDIARDENISKSKFIRKIQKIAVSLYDEGADVDEIVGLTRVPEIKLRRILDERSLKLNYERNNTMMSLLASIEKKQIEIVDAQQRIVILLNDSWK